DLKLRVDTALLLPNATENNAGGSDTISQYLKVKSQLFQSIEAKLSTGSQLDIDFLVQLLKLERSCRGETLGFGRIEKRLITQLTTTDRVTLAFEQLRLDLFEMGPITQEDFQNYFDKLDLLINRFKEIY
ncbi:MAG: hypothetical protein GTN82_31095, partial [Candidatus Aminicenantes bacterium]|nr:hypothetical protein [Candidatus Aminicenantes bacterium]